MISNRKRLGEWLPPEENSVSSFRMELAQVALARTEGLHMEAVAFAKFLEGNAVARMHLERAIAEAADEGHVLGFRDRHELLRVIDYLLTYSPPFSEKSLIVCPLNAVFDWLMCVPSGYAFFRLSEVNAQLCILLRAWSRYLSGTDSRDYLHDGESGWFCARAAEKIGLRDFVWNPSQPFGGFTSWDDFFTRRFRDGARPVADASDACVIVSACESTPYHLASDVEACDTFWIKSQPYSLEDMFAHQGKDLARDYAGGTVYQAYLSAFNYHRWHAPVGGTVARAYLVPGTYYSSLEAEGEDPEGLNDSQGYSTAVATRAVVVIDSDDEAVGQVACLFVGMAEVSSCVVSVKVGQRVKKGAEIGHFQFGGSTWCLLLCPHVRPQFLHHPTAQDSKTVQVNSRLARVAKQAR